MDHTECSALRYTEIAKWMRSSVTYLKKSLKYRLFLRCAHGSNMWTTFICPVIYMKNLHIIQNNHVHATVL